MKKWRRVDCKTSIYALIDPRSGQVRYVGKTIQKLRCRLATHLAHARKGDQDFYLLRWLNELLRAGLRPEMVELELIDEGGDWAEAEAFWIDVMRSWGFRLCNIRPGGEAGNFTKQSAATIEKRVSKLRGRPGRKLSEHEKVIARARLARGRANRVWTPEQRDRVRQLGAAWAHSLKPSGDKCSTSRSILIESTKYGSVYEAARLRGVTRRTIYNWLRDGVAAYADCGAVLEMPAPDIVYRNHAYPVVAYSP